MMNDSVPFFNQFLVLSNHTEATLDAGIQDLKALMPEDAFFGRGVEAGPQVVFFISNLNF